MKIIYPYLPKNKKIKFVPEGNLFMAEAKRISLKSGCVHQPTGAVVVKDGKIIGRGNNSSKKVKTVICPRIAKGSPTGQDYHLCREICLQEGHAEITACKDAVKRGANTKGTDLYLYGHWWCCQDCWREMIQTGIKDVYLVKRAFEKFNVER